MERSSDILKRINELAAERLRLWSKGHLTDQDRERIGRITMELDRLWEKRREERAALAHGMPIRRILAGDLRRPEAPVSSPDSQGPR
ncbi:MAG: DUF2630 family protein [Limnochordaceae bacterium]|uniref:DUF2630 family protein n=1 Tax=Carboxydichorda subterranea TaxID=3109565 RepID=A0ABZ1BYY9_9FIRM|nr:hypothetical protein [Limnochorda sp. L945t]MBE3598924.1 DUF2630 family protein [Limnochordaceae bacterium]WRP17820.1 hypothetical protein U7230_02070 [Limnochorda sp. L945t]